MKELYEIGFVFRGFAMVSHSFRKLPLQKEGGSSQDLRGAFLSAITSFAGSLFQNNSLEYLESGNILFIFKLADVTPIESKMKEPLILYGLVEKKKKPDKIVKKFLEKVEPIMMLFIQRYDNKDFTELNQFLPFKDELKAFFEP